MPFYYRIDPNTAAGKRTAGRLLVLRKQLEEEVPRRTINDTLLLATWNIREFDSPAYGERLDESFYYIAEIISHFDLVAIQEVRENLKGLDKLRKILGSYWRYIVTDVTEGRAGNKERMAFLFDSRKVDLGGLAGEVVIAPVKKGKKTYEPVRQLARTPFICGFRAGWFKFLLCTVHILYGASKADDPLRVKEIEELGKFLARRAKQKTAWSNNLILLGDFNIFRPSDPTFKALTDVKFVIPDKIQKLPSNAAGNKHYDQIAFMLDKNRLGMEKAGVFDFYKSVFREEDEKTYIPAMSSSYYKTSKGKKRNAKSKRSYYKTYWRTHQMSDHLLMWVELKIDFGKEYLRKME
ncbi:MAG: endonuclease/exonuclease/phosphatase family protein [Candidatus Omnitrophica bacterium]|nr:endonuclease/exonuclease/phosphatase family protein [Candidatus Omnitrophota bacterium]